MNTTMENRKVNRQSVVTRMMGLLLLLTMTVGGVNRAVAQDLPTDVTGYETVTVTIPATGYNADAGGTGLGAPQMARVKYNRQCALVITSDDMGTGEYLNNWALMNGYPLYGDWRLGNDGKVNWGICPRGEDALSAPYSTTYMGARSQNVDDYQPLTFTDDAGKAHRFTATSAIWPASYNDNNYAHMQGDEAQIMVRTGWSFAQHDVNNITGDTDAEKIASIASRFQPLSQLWEDNVTGIGLKIMVEPNGDKNYIDATKESNEMCWSIFQSADGTHPAISSSVSTWTASLPTTFSNKSNGSTTRTFPNADATKEQNFLTQTESAIASGSTDAIFYGCHGMGTYPRQLVTDIATNSTYKDKVWVTSADEFWEYYNIYNHAIIGTPNFSDGKLTFTVQVPKYKKNQFRELTINIPGLTGGTDCTLTSSDGTVTTGSYVQTADVSKGYVLNFGMETKILDYIDQLTTLYRNNPTNLFVRRDAQYLIDQLWPGDTKTAKQAALDADFNYTYSINAVLKDGDTEVARSILESGALDSPSDKTYAFPKYIVSDGTLYMAEANASVPYYGGTLTVSGVGTTKDIVYNKTSKTGVTHLVEGETLEGVNIMTTNYNSTKTGDSEYWGMAITSGTQAGCVYDKKIVIATVEPGKYRITAGVYDSYSGNATKGHEFNLLANGEVKASFLNSKGRMLEEAFGDVEYEFHETTTIAISNNYATHDKACCIDYAYIQCTGAVAPFVTLTASPTSGVKKGNPITLTATATLNGNSSLNSILYQYKQDDGDWTDIATVTTGLVSGEGKTQTFTPTSAGSYVFRATATDNGSLSRTSEETNAIIVTNDISTVSLLSDADTASPVVGSTVTLTATATPTSGSTVTYLAIERNVSGAYTPIEDAVYSTPSAARNIKKTSSVNAATGEVTVTYEFTAASGESYDFRANATFSDGDTPKTVLSTDAVASGGDGSALELTTTTPAARELTFIVYKPDGTAEGNVSSTTSASTIAYDAALATVFSSDTNLKTLMRQYCDYTFYSDAALTNAITVADGQISNNTVYVKWTYADNAPVFSTGTDATQFQYYAFVNNSNKYHGSNNNTSESTFYTQTNVDAITKDDTGYHWAFVGTPYNLKIYNRKAQKYLYVSSVVKNASIQLSTDPTVSHSSFQLPYSDWTSTYSVSSWGQYNGNFIVLQLTEQAGSDGYLNICTNQLKKNVSDGAEQYSRMKLTNIVVPKNVFVDAAGTAPDPDPSTDVLLPYPRYNSEGTLSAGSETITTSSVSGLPDSSHEYTYYTNSTCTTLLSSNPINIFGGSSQTRKAVYALYYSAPTPPTVTLTAAATETTKGTSVTLTATATKNSGTAITKVAIEQQNADGSTYTEVASVTNGTATATYSFPADSYGDFYFRAYAVVDGDETNLKGQTDADVAVSVVFPTPKNDSYTLILYDKSDIQVFDDISVTKAEVQAALGDALPGRYRSPFVARYKYYATQAEAKANSGTEFDWANSDATTVYVGYEVDDTKMAAAKEHIIYSGWTDSKVFMHPVYRGQQSNSSDFQLRYNMQHQKWDEENNGITPNAVNAGNLPFVDQVYMWSLGTDPYHVMLTNNHIDSYKYIKMAYNTTSSATAVSLQNTAANGSVFSLLYWNGDTSSEYASLRYLGDNTGDAAYKTDTNAWFLCYDGGNEGCWRLYGNPTIGDSYKFVIKNLPSLNVNVVDAAGAVEYTMKGYYVEGATVPNYTPFFLQRSYTSNHRYYYNSACTQYANPNGAINTDNFDGANIYVKYNLSSDWNTDNLFLVSDATDKHYYLLNYTANTSTPYLAVDGTKKVIGLSTSTTNEAQWALYGTPYALRIESRANSGYYVGIPENAVGNTNPQVYDSFSGIISTWELAAYTNSNITAAYKPLPVIRPQGSISREAPLLHLRPNDTNAALFDHDDNNCRVTFEDATKVQLVVVDKSGREVFSEHVSLATITSTSGDPLSVGFRSPYAKNYKYYANAEEAKTNSGEALDASGISAKVDETVYVGYDINAADGETILHTDGTAYRIRRNTSDTQGMHATFLPSGANSSDNNYGWKMERQSRDYDDGSSNVVNYNTLPFIDRSWAWEFVNSNGDPYSVKIRNKATGQYLRCENNSTKSYQAMFTDSESEAALYSLLKFDSDNTHHYLAIYVTDNNVSQTGYLYYNTSDDGTWRLRSTRNDGSNSALAYIRIDELTTPLDIHVVAPANAPNAGEVEATLHGYRNTDVGANTVPSFAPYFLARAYTSDQKFYYTQEAAAAATSGTEISTVDDESITDSYGSDGVKDVFVSYTLDAANWIPSGTALTDAAKTANTTIIKPFYSGEGKINWYGIRTHELNTNCLKADGTLPAVITRTSISTATADLDTEAMKRCEWAIIGTPYNLQLVERYHGTAAHLGMPEDAVPNTSRAYVYPSGTEDVVTTFELVTGLSGTTGKLFLRPQGALNAQAPNLYIGGNDNNMAVSRGAGSAQVIDLTWLKETDAKSVTFTLRDRDGNSMSSIVDDFTLTGVTQGDDLADLFSTTGLARRYCEYAYFSDDALTTTMTAVGSADDETIYVKWQYTDDAPVFSTGSEPRDYQYYMINVSNGSSPYTMNVTGNSTDGYTVAPSSSHTILKEGHKQFALVGTPYAFTLYSRYACMNLKTNNNRNLVLADQYESVATADIVFDMPIPVNSAITQSTQIDVRVKAAPTNHIWCSADGFWMETSTGGFAQLMYMVVPVRVFKEGSTALANIVDYQEYALELNPNGTARATDARMTDSDLYRSTDTSSPNYHTKDFRHAFCDYTFYHTYDWSTGALSNAIPSTGNYAGLPYYGGSTNQFARSFFATYTVDEEQFSTIYLLDNANSDGLRFLGSNTETINGDKVYYNLKCEETTLAGARNDNTKAYRWQLTGDPYNLQLTCLGTGDDYQDIPLGVTNVSTTNAAPTVEAGTLARLTNDATYAAKSHWEVVLNSTGNHIFFLTDDVTTYDDADRYTYSLGQQTYTSANLFASSDKLYVLHLTPAVPQYDVVWNIMEESSSSYTSVATYTKKNVSMGTTVTLADMPEVLKRHFCEYNNMYSEQTCTTQYTGNEATVGEENLNIYVPYTLAAGAPIFYASVAAFTSAEGDAKDPVLIRLNKAKYAYTTNADDESATTTDSKETASSSKWVLIGSPYNVKLYNIKTGKYLYVNWSNISPNAVIPMAVSPDANTTNDTWTILDDATGDYAVLCLKEEDNHQLVFIGYDTNGDVVMNIPNSKSGAMTAEFLGSNGIDGPTLILHYGENTLRKGIVNNAEVSMAGKTESFQVSGFFNQGTPLVDIMPSVMKRPFCNYTFKYNETAYEAVVKDPMCTASQPITIDVYYTRDESLFKWSTNNNNDYTGKYWYYLVNNHVPAGSGEEGRMVYRDSEPKLRASEALVQNKLYLNNYEWCVIGDPYGFKMLNRYDPDHKFNEYISVTDDYDSHNDGLQLEQQANNANHIFEMMPGLYSYNFWMHPVYTSALRNELTADECSYVGNNYNGSAAIIPTTKKSISYLHTNNAANFRLEIQSNATLAEYVKYAGFVGGLKYNLAESYISDATTDGNLSDENKTAIRELIDNPENIVQMKQGYYRIVPHAWENKAGETKRHYIRGYLNANEIESSLKVEAQNTDTPGQGAEYDPASIFWFEHTTFDDTETGYPRYYVRTQGLNLNGNKLVQPSAEETGYKCRYEDVGAAVMQLKIADVSASNDNVYLGCADGDNTTAEHCFDEHRLNGVLLYNKTRLYLQPVGTGDNELPFKMKMNKGHDENALNTTLAALPYTYASIKVPYDLEMVGGLDKDGIKIENIANCDMIPFVGTVENLHPTYSMTSQTYYNAGEWALICYSIDEFTDDPRGYKYVPAGTPVVCRSNSGMSEVTFIIPSTSPSEAVVGNSFEGSYLETTDNDSQIRLFGKESVSYQDNGVEKRGFSGRVGFFPRGTAISNYIPANKVFYRQINRSGGNSRDAIFFEFLDGTDTGITTNSRQYDCDETLYDLQGRKVEHVNRPGVYIMNGRKVVLK